MSGRKFYKKGDTVAGLTVLAEVGRGAASVIYLVQDPKTKQIWALKHVIRKTKKDQRFIDQTEQEYAIGSKLDDPLLRKVVKLIKKRTMLTLREVYLLMEYVDGVSLEQDRPDAIIDLVNIFNLSAKGLAHMHAKGFVHADIKPNNIILVENSVKIIDLGQSCPIGFVKERIQGTPDYIAPEQVHRRPITPKTDIYNLGATMYWRLTGKHIPTALPKGDSLVGSLDDQFIEKPTPVSELNPDIPDRLATLIMACVEVDPDHRPADMGLVADRLDLIHAQLTAQALHANGVPLIEDNEDEDDEGNDTGASERITA